MPEIAFYPDKCRKCDICAEVCLYDASVVIGKQVTVQEVITEVKKDEIFYANSGGGLTVTGGEPYFQSEFTLALLNLAKENGLHTCVETSGAVAFELLEQSAKVTDIFLYDIKDTASDRHKAYTGVSNELIIENLMKLDKLGVTITLRCTIIPGINDDDAHFKNLGALAEKLKNVTHIDIQPYHSMGTAKAVAIGKKPWDASVPLADKEQVEQWAQQLRKYTSTPINIS